MNARWLILIFLLAGLAVVHGCKIKEEEQSLQKPQAIHTPAANLPISAPVGSRAITPRTAGTPAFSVEDAKQYVTSHPLPMQEGKGTKPTIIAAEFLDSKEVVHRLGGITTGFPDDYPLCYVELQGSFTFVGPPGSKATYNRGFAIFDAHTGNLVIGGGLP
jgi:hypothetical protein